MSLDGRAIVDLSIYIYWFRFHLGDMSLDGRDWLWDSTSVYIHILIHISFRWYVVRRKGLIVIRDLSFGFRPNQLQGRSPFLRTGTRPYRGYIGRMERKPGHNRWLRDKENVARDKTRSSSITLRCNTPSAASPTTMAMDGYSTKCNNKHGSRSIAPTPSFTIHCRHQASHAPCDTLARAKRYPELWASL
jgi:hypothetical protein